jgi:tetratricopeptide (TPR) repeat protein
MAKAWWSYGISIGVIAVSAVVIALANRGASRERVKSPQSDEVATSSTSRDGLQRTIQAMERRLREHPGEAAAAVSLADALLRQARVSNNPGLAFRAEDALKRVLKDDPATYDARRILGAVYLSQHRFREAIREAERAGVERPTDDWNYGVMGDGHLELGEYDEAWSAFQKMMDLRPTAGAYARAAYALELRGRLDAALQAMQLSTDATPPSDRESLAWHHAQLGDLYRQLGRPADAALEYAWADHSFPNHPFADRGRAELLEAEGDLAGAVATLEAVMAQSPAPDLAAKLGDLYTTLGRDADASRAYALAEAGWRFDAPEPARLARFLADHGRKLDEAVALAERTEAGRHDIFSEDALAWCYFKSGRLADATAAISRAQRTGTRDRMIRSHAAAIAAAQTRLSEASRCGGRNTTDRRPCRAAIPAASGVRSTDTPETRPVAPRERL